MTEPTTYTGREVCPKCGYGELTASHDPETNNLQLQCGRCAYRWVVKSLDSP